MSDQYEDIINLPHHVSKTRQQMSMQQRAAHFSPFAALSGHADAIREVSRRKERWTAPDEEEAKLLDRKMLYLRDRLWEGIEVTFIYFEPESEKETGYYRSVTGFVRKIDLFNRWVIMENGQKISIDYIKDMQGETFDEVTE